MRTTAGDRRWKGNTSLKRSGGENTEGALETVWNTPQLIHSASLAFAPQVMCIETVRFALIVSLFLLASLHLRCTPPHFTSEGTLETVWICTPSASSPILRSSRFGPIRGCICGAKNTVLHIVSLLLYIFGVLHPRSASSFLHLLHLHLRCMCVQPQGHWIAKDGSETCGVHREGWDQYNTAE